jgi:hypothetical protein
MKQKTAGQYDRLPLVHPLASGGPFSAGFLTVPIIKPRRKIINKLPRDVGRGNLRYDIDADCANIVDEIASRYRLG